MARVLDTLEVHPLFQGMGRDDLAPLVVECRLRTPRKGDRVFGAGEPAEAFFIAASGRVKLSRTGPQGREHVVEVIRAGESFALMPVLEGGSYPVDATALSDAALVRIPREGFLRFLSRHPELHSRTSREVAERLRRFSSRLEEVSTRPVQARIASHILALAKREGTPLAPGIVVDLGATREVAAATVGTVREVFIRTLKSIEREGVVALRARKVEILDPSRLEEMAGG